MINEKVEIEVYGRKFSIEIEGLTQLEVHSLAQDLTEKMEKISKESEIVDSSKLAILTALETLAEMSRVKAQHDALRNAQERAMDHMILELEGALAANR
jgi:cell division protein ZapA (FtsZ GTPase activity inhibitor)